jgi:hypothetical protein
LGVGIFDGVVETCVRLISCLVVIFPVVWSTQVLETGQANFWYPKYCPVQYPHHFRQDGGQFISFGRDLLLEFVLQGGSWQTELVAQVIFPMI